MRFEGDAAHQRGVISARPAKGLCRRALEVAGWKILSDDRHQSDGREDGGGIGRVGGRSADHVFGGDGRELDIVESHRADNEEGRHLLVHDHFLWKSHSSSARLASEISDRSVKMAAPSAPRAGLFSGSGKVEASSAINRLVVSRLRFRTSRTAPTLTSSW